MIRFDTIETSRLVLRRWRDADRAPFAALNGDQETMVFFPSTLTRAESDALVDRIEGRFAVDGYGLWALEVRDTGQFIGFTGLAPMPDDVPGAGGTEIGWRLARDAWHHGYATEAALAARDVAFTGAGLAELWSMTAVLNTPSQAVMSRIGMTEAAHFEHPRVPGGSPLKPHVVYRLSRLSNKRSLAQTDMSIERLDREVPQMTGHSFDDLDQDYQSRLLLNASPDVVFAALTTGHRPTRTAAGHGRGASRRTPAEILTS